MEMQLSSREVLSVLGIDSTKSSTVNIGPGRFDPSLLSDIRHALPATLMLDRDLENVSVITVDNSPGAYVISAVDINESK
jgi:hypothetical protein